jgi:2-dehydropantoate 2-reductase
MKIVIVGAGAMGCLFAALLRRAGFHVQLLEKNDAARAAILHNGIRLENSTGTHRFDGIAVASDAETIGQADYIIFFVKAFDTEQASASVGPCAGPETAIVTLQNGIGNAEILAGQFPTHCILAGTTAHGSTLLEAGYVRHAGCGATAVGALRPQERFRAVELCAIFGKAGIESSVFDEVSSVLWNKLIVNCGINPLAAVLDINNGRILELEPVRSIMHAAVREAVSVGAALGIHMAPDEQIERVEQVCLATQANICSMLQDLRAGRRTEIDYMNGAVVHEARARNLCVPTNSMLCDLVHAKERLAVKESGSH